MSAAFLRKYNTAITATTAQSIKIPMIKRGVVDFAVGADWTPATGDVKVSKDGGAAASIATLPAAVAMGNTAYWEFVFSNTELACGTLVVTVADSATKAVEDQEFIIETFGNASAMYVWDMSAANTPQTGDSYARIGAAGAGLTGVTGATLSEAYDAAKTAAQAGDAMALTSGERNATADAILNRNMATGTDSSSDSVRTPRSALRQIRNKWSISGGTIQYTKEDDTTASHTAALTGTAGADPITASDPA